MTTRGGYRKPQQFATSTSKAGCSQTRTFDATSGQWLDVGAATERWKPSERGSLTASQTRENAAITQARDTLDQLGMDREEIIAASQEATATGRPNPDHNPYIAGLARQATKRLYGADPDFEARYNFLHIPPPEPLPVAEPTPAPEGPGLLDSARDFFGFGEDTTAAGASTLPPEPKPLSLNTGRLWPAGRPVGA